MHLDLVDWVNLIVIICLWGVVYLDWKRDKERKQEIERLRRLTED